MSEEILPGFGLLPDVGEQEALFAVRHDDGDAAPRAGTAVAHVLPLGQLPHLSRPFDYEIPPELDAEVKVGLRVTVPFGNKVVDGYVVGRDTTSCRRGRLKPVKRVVSSLQLASPEILDLAAEVGAAYGGSAADCLRLAVPQRHAKAEKRILEDGAIAAAAAPRRAPCHHWRQYSRGQEYIESLEAGKAPRAACCGLAGPAGSTELVADAVAAVLANGRSAIVVSPTRRYARLVADQLESALAVPVARLLSSDSVEERYAAFLETLLGRVRVVVGTRAAVWAPARDLGLVVILDDAAEAHRAERAPYCHTRDIALRRARKENAALLVFSPYLSEESCALVEAGTLVLLEGRQSIRSAMIPRISLADQWRGGEETGGQLPEPVFALVRDSIARGPVLVVVPRSGYLPVLACQTCRDIATCPECAGSLALENTHKAPACTRCGTSVRTFRCPNCGSGKLRAARIGSSRTVQDIARAFPGYGVLHSSSTAEQGILNAVSSRPRIVVATPGAEPGAKGGYSAAVIVDSRFLQGKGLGAQTRLVRTVTRIAARVRPRSAGGHVMLAGHADRALVAAVSNWALGDFAHRLCSERKELRLPPAAAWFSLSGPKANVRHLLAELRKVLERLPLAGQSETGLDDPLLAGGITSLAPGVELLGPAAGSTDALSTVYARVVPAQADELGSRLRIAHRSHCSAGFSPVRIERDPAM